MADRTWVNLYVPSRFVNTVLRVPRQADHWSSPALGVARLEFHDTIADEDQYNPSVPWLMHHGSYTGQWSCGAIVNTGDPSFPRVTVATSETSTLPHIPVKPNGRVSQPELEEARRFFKALRWIHTRHGVQLPVNP